MIKSLKNRTEWDARFKKNWEDATRRGDVRKATAVNIKCWENTEAYILKHLNN